jgi:hypothetical protein
MDQVTVVNEQTESGNRLINALALAGFEVRVAFWARPTDDEKWFLYLGSPFVDENGARAAYRFVHDVMRKLPDVWIDPLDIKVVGLNDSMTEDVLDVTKPNIPNSPYAVRNPKPYPAMTRFGGSSLGGVEIDGAYIYPPMESGTTH